MNQTQNPAVHPPTQQNANLVEYKQKNRWEKSGFTILARNERLDQQPRVNSILTSIPEPHGEGINKSHETQDQRDNHEFTASM